MDVQILRKAFALIASGLVEKEKLLTAEPNRYPHSPRLQHGINMFLAAAWEIGKVGDKIWEYADEASFLDKYACRSIADWFSDWDKEAIESLHLTEQPFYGFGSFIMWLDDNRYSYTDDCTEYLESLDNDILNGTEERILYEKMKELSQEQYTLIREFIIQHPLVSKDKLLNLKMEMTGSPIAADALNFAYEEWDGEAYRCPYCGWTMKVGKYGPVCHSRHCTDITPVLTEDMKINQSKEPLRLKKGIMRYFAMPGKLEIEIANYCRDLGLNPTLWPMMDTYDIEIKFPDGEIWEIDAKAYRNPIALKNKVSTDEAFNREGYDRGFYVIPSEYVKNIRNYTKIVNKVIKNKRVKCITSHTLKKEIKGKVEQLHEK